MLTHEDIVFNYKFKAVVTSAVVVVAVIILVFIYLTHVPLKFLKFKDELLHLIPSCPTLMTVQRVHICPSVCKN